MKMDTSDARTQCHHRRYYVQSGHGSEQGRCISHTGIGSKDLIHQVFGARDLRECLILQLDKMDKSGDHSRPRTLAMKILVDYFEEFTKSTIKNLNEHTMYIDSELKKEAIDEILKLNPNPARWRKVPKHQPLHRTRLYHSQP